MLASGKGFLTEKTMKLFFVLSLSLLMVQMGQAEDNDNIIPRIDFEYKVILSTGMELALKKYDPEFYIFEANTYYPIMRKVYPYKVFWFDRAGVTGYQTPAVVIGDFNGDVKADAVLIGRNKTHKKQLVILSDGDKYHVTEFIASYPVSTATKDFRIDMCLGLTPPGKVKAEPAYDRPEIDLKTDAFTYGGCEGPHGIYIYHKGKFVDYALSD